MPPLPSQKQQTSAPAVEDRRLLRVRDAARAITIPGFGLNFGAGYTFPDINLQARVDVSYFDFSYDYAGLYDFSYTRIPITVSARYYFPINDSLKAFAQAGIETSIDSFDEPTFFFGLNHNGG